MMYPLKFKPVYQSRIWGGSRLKNVLGKTLPPEFAGKPIAESWELADLPAGTVKGESTGGAKDGSLSSMIANGALAGRTLREVIEKQHAEIMGNVPLRRGYFPLLVKFLDAGSEVSVQVHPDAGYCSRHPEAHLKCEAWYVVLADPGAKIYKGLKAGVTKADFLAALEKGNVEPLLRAIPVRAGDCHYLVSGTVHALGAGCTVVEVQTPSDTTFRVFDWNRLGADGKTRQLHVEQALACINFDEAPGEPIADSHAAGQVAACDYFTLHRQRLGQSQEQVLPGGEPMLMVILEGQGVINCTDHPPTAFVRGDTILLPAGMKEGRMKTVAQCTWLEARVPRSGLENG